MNISKSARVGSRGDAPLNRGMVLLMPKARMESVSTAVSTHWALLRELPYDPSNMMRGVVSCTGIDYCLMKKDVTVSVAAKA
jgi:hypothetical protein